MLCILQFIIYQIFSLANNVLIHHVTETHTHTHQQSSFEHIFAPNGGYCVYSSNMFHNILDWGISLGYSSSFSWGICEAHIKSAAEKFVRL